jgi:hypothetical protein
VLCCSLFSRQPQPQLAPAAFSRPVRTSYELCFAGGRWPACGWRVPPGGGGGRDAVRARQWHLPAREAAASSSACAACGRADRLARARAAAKLGSGSGSGSSGQQASRPKGGRLKAPAVPCACRRVRVLWRGRGLWVAWRGYGDQCPPHDVPRRTARRVLSTYDLHMRFLNIEIDSRSFRPKRCIHRLETRYDRKARYTSL